MEYRSEKEQKIEQMQNLIVLLNQASKAYYQESREIMPNYKYDQLYDELEALEKETGVTLSQSPTMKVGYEVLSDLPKEAHPSKMLSLDKTKDRDQLVSWLGVQEGVLSWKLDGLTIVLTYDQGKLVKAVTRGNGEIGEVVTNNARMFTNVPVTIDFKGRLVLRGEAVITYPDFEKINEEITDEGARYKNPRNLCAGSVRQLSNQITAERHVRFYAFALVSAEGLEFTRRTEQFDWLSSQGFSVVEHRLVTGSDLKESIQWFSDRIEDNILPSDGLVLSFDDIVYGRSLGQTAKFPRDSIAFKWQDEIRETTLQEIEWSASRTGLINPVAVFEPVELEGTTVSRASVHNLSVMKELGLGIGDRILVYKANMIIPQISENLTRSGRIHVPEVCPVCGSDTVIHNENGVETLFCPNPDCLAKQIKRLTLFVSRDAMDIGGLSEMTLEKLVDRGMIHELADVFHLDRYRQQIIEMEGFGEKSFNNLISAVEKARNPSTDRFLYSLGIPNIGTANARLIAGHCRNQWNAVESLTKEELMTIDGVGEVMADAFVSWFNDEENQKTVSDLLAEVTLDESYEAAGTAFEGLTFVITGSLNHYANREALKAEIEAAGGKVAGSVSAKTSYLINNELTSGSGKNRKAKELGIPIIDEETVKDWLEAGAVIQ
ncbi:MAG: NAD-dependent DNA ligase LigA [Firmicutes bacterium]|nr:NAD-dependent DNA ligase LigA [Bacillota bacterium]MDD7602258.1 NAD-dependent DNA ligase LigA [Bacillota bacterium]MDY5857578.1 NAD-dependent DNA ligase LigA [Anaerovoracaceae bacterium]